MSVLAAAIGAGSSLLGNMLNRQAEDRAYARSLDLMRQQNDFNLQMWHRNNAYNSPSNQMRLIKEAGINPAIYGSQGQMASPQSTEVTSASADVPYNSSAGEHLASGAQRTMEALFQEVQIAKLRKELKALDYDIELKGYINRDKANELKAKEEPYPSLLNESDLDFSDGDLSQTIYPDTNAYTEERQRSRMNILRESQDYKQKFQEYQVYLAIMPWLKQMPEKQFENLAQELRQKSLNNQLLEDDVQMMKKYGIKPGDKDAYTTLIRMILRNPDVALNVMDSVAHFGYNTAVGTFERLKSLFSGDNSSHSNPKRHR